MVLGDDVNTRGLIYKEFHAVGVSNGFKDASHIYGVYWWPAVNLVKLYAELNQ